MTKPKAAPIPTLAILWLADAYGTPCPLCGECSGNPDETPQPVLCAVPAGHAPAALCRTCAETLAPELAGMISEYFTYRNLIASVPLFDLKLDCARHMLTVAEPGRYGHPEATEHDVLALALANGLNALLRRVLPERLARALPEVVCSLSDAPPDEDTIPF